MYVQYRFLYLAMQAHINSVVHAVRLILSTFSTNISQYPTVIHILIFNRKHCSDICCTLYNIQHAWGHKEMSYILADQYRSRI
jgi:hypothetical protein